MAQRNPEPESAMRKGERRANMNAKKWVLRGLCLVCVVVQSGCKRASSNSSGAPVATNLSSHTIKITALIDGADTIKIRGREIWSQSPAETKLTKIDARGGVTISQMPSPENDQTLAIHLDDSQIMGAAWYEVEISWK
ncbi:MAG TPA: hypothetical protein VGR14_07320 [Verrucomicrobiae bacterium]|jgi:hypothetical protein|nr:hypothetical protein [Verrucomicrobiae bacterium]